MDFSNLKYRRKLFVVENQEMYVEYLIGKIPRTLE